MNSTLELNQLLIPRHLHINVKLDEVYSQCSQSNTDKDSYNHTTKMEQIIEHLVDVTERMDAKTDTNKGKMDANLKEIRACQEHLIQEIRANQKLLKEEMVAKLYSDHEQMMARMNAQIKKM
jgi:cell division FtsZ-interacting protein ZapD